MQVSSARRTRASYNDRLFSGGLRSYFHFARFRWVADEIARLKLPCASVLELGCYDGRLIQHLPAPPARYVGVDANWEKGLDLASKKYAGDSRFTFIEARRPQEMASVEGAFDLGASLETLEHIPPQMIDGYLAALASRVSHLVVTVPNETGPLFLAKWVAKHCIRQGDRYSVSEVFFAAIGRTDRVQRNEHKGFNYRDMVRQIDRHFDVVRVQGFPMRWLPTWLCFGVGISAQARRIEGGQPRPVQAVRTQK